MQEVSVIEVLEEFKEAFIQNRRRGVLNVIFFFNKSNGEYKFICNTPMGEEKGVFLYVEVLKDQTV